MITLMVWCKVLIHKISDMPKLLEMIKLLWKITVKTRKLEFGFISNARKLLKY